MSELKEVRIDLQRITPAELKEIEERVDRPLADLGKPGVKQADLIWALAYVAGRRIDPTLTWEEAGDLNVFIENGKVPPTTAGG